MSDTTTQPPLKVYWQPGCSSCLKTKEFLIENGMDFESINVIEDEEGFNDLQRFGVRLVPIVARGDDWANGAVFRDVARVAGFHYGGHVMLDPADMVEKINAIMSGARRFTDQIPDDQLDVMLPGRPRTYRMLCYHIINIPEVFLDYVENGEPYTYEALLSNVPEDISDRVDMATWAGEVQDRFNTWWNRDGKTTDFDQPANVYYGDVTLHEVLERTGWHSGQHTRQVMLLLREKLGIQPNEPVTDDVFAGLPLPKNIWDNERSFDEESFAGSS